MIKAGGPHAVSSNRSQLPELSIGLSKHKILCRADSPVPEENIRGQPEDTPRQVRCKKIRQNRLRHSAVSKQAGYNGKGYVPHPPPLIYYSENGGAPGDKPGDQPTPETYYDDADQTMMKGAPRSIKHFG